MSANLNLHDLLGGFLWAGSSLDNPNGAIFYLDDIQFLFNVNIPPQPHSIYYGPRLADGYDMGVNTSGGLTNWVTDMSGYMRMTYPSGQSWGSVFITVGPPRPFPRPEQDLSSYKTLSLELRGELGGEDIWIGLKDNTKLLTAYQAALAMKGFQRDIRCALEAFLPVLIRQESSPKRQVLVYTTAL